MFGSWSQEQLPLVAERELTTALAGLQEADSTFISQVERCSALHGVLGGWFFFS